MSLCPVKKTLMPKWEPNKNYGEDAIDWVWTVLRANAGPISFAHLLKRFTGRKDLYRKYDPQDRLHRIIAQGNMHEAQDGMIRKIKSTGEHTGDTET